MTVREKYSHIDLLEQQLAISAPYMANHIERCKSQFGKEWCEKFEHTLGIQFDGDLQKIEKAVKAYANFSIEAVLLQKRFSKERKYSAASLDEAVKEVYENQNYMLNYYL